MLPADQDHTAFGQRVLDHVGVGFFLCLALASRSSAAATAEMVWNGRWLGVLSV
jgi:hypothetical protein